MIDIKLDTTTHDLDLSTLDLQFVDGLDYIAQKLKIRLWFLLGEWFLDTTEGVPYFEEILVKTPDISKIETILKSTILETDGVTEMLIFNTTFDRALRKFTVTFTVNTIYGILERSETL
jgi:hypothetical protein